MASTASPVEPVVPGTSEPDSSARKAAFWRVALLIGISVFINSNIIAITNLLSTFLLKDTLHLAPAAMSTFNIFAGIPAYLRPFMGAGSDLFPLFGFHRKSYYALAWILMAVGYLALALLHSYHYGAVLGLVIVTAAGGNLVFVIMDAVMVLIGNMTGTVGRLQTIQQGIPMLLGLTYAGPLSGWLASHLSYAQGFMAAAAVAVLGIPLTLLIPENRLTSHSDLGTQEERELSQAKRREDHARSFAALRQAARSWHLWAIVGYVFYLILTPGTGTPQLFYSVNVLHFSKQFLGFLAIPSSAGSILAILLFAAVSRRISVRSVVWTAFLMDCSLYLISMGLRNHSTGIIVALVSSFFGTVYNLSLLTLAARATPKGVEGTVYGLVMAAITLAGTLGDLIGSKIFTFFGPAHHYSLAHGWFALLWFGFAFTVIAVVFIPFLPAWARSSEPLGSTEQHSPD